MFKRKNAVTAILTAALTTSLLAACTAGKPNGTSQPSQTAAGSGSETAADLKKITFSLDWTPNTNHTGLYVALDKGWFREEGLDVTIIQPSENTAATLVAAGQAQFGIDAQDTMASALALENPLGITAVATVLQHNTSGIIARAGEGLDRPAGLEGKRYSTWNNPIEIAMIENLVTEDGGDFSQVVLIPNTVTDEAAALQAGQTDAIWIFYGWSGINAELSGLDFDYYNLIDLNPVLDYYTPVIIANNDFLNDEPEAAAAFLKAAEKGYRFAAENPEEAAQILIDADSTGSLRGSEQLVTASQEWISDRYFSEDGEWGRIEAARWDAFYAWLNEESLVENELVSGAGFTNDYLPAD